MPSWIKSHTVSGLMTPDVPEAHWNCRAFFWQSSCTAFLKLQEMLGFYTYHVKYLHQNPFLFGLKNEQFSQHAAQSFRFGLGWDKHSPILGEMFGWGYTDIK